MGEVAPTGRPEIKQPQLDGHERLYDLVAAASGQIEGYQQQCNVFSRGEELIKFSLFSGRSASAATVTIFSDLEISLSEYVRADSYELKRDKHGWQLDNYKLDYCLENATAVDYQTCLFEPDQAKIYSDRTEARQIRGDISWLEQYLLKVVEEGQLVYRSPNIHPEIMLVLGDQLLAQAKRLLTRPDQQDELYKIVNLDAVDANATIEVLGDFAANKPPLIEELWIHSHPTSPLDLNVVNGRHLGEALWLYYNVDKNEADVRKLTLEYDPDTLLPLNLSQATVHQNLNLSAVADINQILRVVANLNPPES